LLDEKQRCSSVLASPALSSHGRRLLLGDSLALRNLMLHKAAPSLLLLWRRATSAP
jgi:hypothetical protein